MNTRKWIYALAAIWMLFCVYADVVRPRLQERSRADKPSAAYAAYVQSATP